MTKQPIPNVTDRPFYLVKAARFGITVAGFMLAVTAPAWAQAGTLQGAQPLALRPIGLPRGIELVGPGVMKQVRGRYVGPNGSVVYFGVTLSSDWMSGGSEVRAHLSLGFRPGRHPDVQVTGASIDGSFGSPSTSRGTRSISGDPPVNHMGNGLGQSIQVAGRGNSIHNSLDVSNRVGPPPEPTASLATVFPKTASCGTGCQATLKLLHNQLGLTINNGNRGAIAQLVGGGRVTQSAQIKSDFNSIVNALHVDIYHANEGSPVVGASTLQGLLNSLPQR